MKPKFLAIPFVPENTADGALIEAIARPIAVQMVKDCTLPSGYSSTKAVTEYLAAFALLVATATAGLEPESEKALLGAFHAFLKGYQQGLRNQRVRRRSPSRPQA